MNFFLLSLVLAIASVARAATAEDWRSRRIYQVMTDRFALKNGSTTLPCDPAPDIYCGGDWQGILNNLDYIQDMGFDAVWISPVTLPVDDPHAYHGYWPSDMTKVNSNFGDAADLLALSQELHIREMYLMVDIVVNHMAWAGSQTTVDYSDLIPFNSSSYYHPFCPITNNETVCWVGGGDVNLPDLRTEDTDVRDVFGTWISQLVSQYSIDGLRLDSAVNVDVDFFASFSKAAGVFCTAEVDSGVTADVCAYQNTTGSVLNYPAYFPLIRAFQSTQGSSGSLVDLATEINVVKESCSDTTILGSFSENHDQPRFPSYTNDLSLVKNVLAYTMLTDGIPIVYQGQEQHYGGGASPLDREAIWLSSYNTSSPLYSYITDLNVFRKQFSTAGDYLNYNTISIYNNTNTLGLRKGNDGGQVITVLNNDGSYGESRNITLSNSTTGFAAGDIVTDVIACQNSTIDVDGNLEVVIGQFGVPNVFYLAKLLSGSTICVGGKTTYSVPAPVTSTSAVSTATGTRKPTASATKSGSSNPTATSESGRSGSSGSGNKSSAVRSFDEFDALLALSSIAICAFLL